MASPAFPPRLKRQVKAALRPLRTAQAGLLWRLKGSCYPLPPPLKRAILRRLARMHGARIFVESGTFFGETVEALRGHFKMLHSIELSAELHQRALRRLGDFPNIRLWHGDSGDVLIDVLQVVDEPALFWLDGHYSGGPTAKGIETTPVFRELNAIAQHSLKAAHMIAIDDARLFDGADGYPTMETLRRETEHLGFSHMTVVDDMILLRAGPH